MGLYSEQTADGEVTWEEQTALLQESWSSVRPSLPPTKASTEMLARPVRAPEQLPILTTWLSKVWFVRSGRDSLIWSVNTLCATVNKVFHSQSGGQPFAF